MFGRFSAPRALARSDQALHERTEPKGPGRMEGSAVQISAGACLDDAESKGKGRRASGRERGEEERMETRRIGGWPMGGDKVRFGRLGGVGKKRKKKKRDLKADPSGCRHCLHRCPLRFPMPSHGWMRREQSSSVQSAQAGGGGTRYFGRPSAPPPLPVCPR